MRRPSVQRAPEAVGGSSIGRHVSGTGSARGEPWWAASAWRGGASGFSARGTGPTWFLLRTTKYEKQVSWCREKIQNANNKQVNKSIIYTRKMGRGIASRGARTLAGGVPRRFLFMVSRHHHVPCAHGDSLLPYKFDLIVLRLRQKKGSVICTSLLVVPLLTLIAFEFWRIF